MCPKYMRRCIVVAVDRRTAETAVWQFDPLTERAAYSVWKEKKLMQHLYEATRRIAHSLSVTPHRAKKRRFQDYTQDCIYQCLRAIAQFLGDDGPILEVLK